MKKRKIMIVVTAVIALAALAGCTDKVKPGTSEVKRQQVSGISIETINPSPMDDLYETTGTIRPKTLSTVSGRLMGTITSVRVKEGDRVSAGQLLLTIDDSDVAHKVTAAAEGYKEAQKGLAAAKENRDLREVSLQRYRKLYDEKALSRQELDQIETQKKVAVLDHERAEAAVKRVGAGLSEAKVYQGFSQVRSPVSGIVTEKKAEPGSMAVPGMPLVTVEDNSSYRLEVHVDEKISGRLRTGMKVSVFIDSLGREITGTISDVVQSVDPASRTFLVKVALQAEGLRSGFYARVGIPVGTKEVLSVPKGAVVEKGQLTGVYTVDAASVIKYRLVRTGRTYGDRVEILAGLNPGDRIIVAGIDKAVDGGIAAAGQ
ncbi:MAG: efflux RND transporter periplasmic adaptor subunit [Thermodesulfovibrionales bacterium]